MKFKNERKFPARYYARHIKEGLVHYLEKGNDKLYLVTNEALRQMNPSFEGKPVFVRHVEDVNLDTLKEDADGYVVKSFYNEFDGAWWSEIIVVSDEGHDAVEKGWAVSNCYLPTELGAGGVYHDIPYDKEIKRGKYEHLAIVPNPRYEEAVIMTPEEFKSFNEERQQQLQQLKNSKENEEMEISEEKLNSLLQNAADCAAERAVEKMKEKLEDERKKNDREDKRRLIREIGALQDKPASEFEGGEDEKWRTITSLAEKLAYSESERSKEDNSKKNDVPSGDEEASHKREPLKLDNEDVDKRDLIRQIMAIAGKTASEEDVRTIGEKAEELAYDKSERGTKDNKKNEEDKPKEEEKKENSKSWFSALKNARSSRQEVKAVATMASGLALGKERYGSKD